MVNEKSSARLQKWKNKYDTAKIRYAPQLEAMKRREKYYNGNRVVLDKNGAPTKRTSSNVRNIVFELIESQVDCTVPMPRVEPVHEEDRDIARQIESLLRNEMQRMRLAEINDQQERTCPIDGGDFWLVEWDPSAGMHCTIGDVAVSELHPRCVIPQPGVYDIDRMEYLFVVSSQTVEAIKRKFGKDVSGETEEESDARQSASDEATQEAGIVSQIDCYYRNGKGGIGLISWVGDTMLRDEADYQARKLERCTKCGRVKDGDVCACGNKKFKVSDEDSFAINTDIVTIGPAGEKRTIPAETEGEPIYAGNPDGTPQYLTDEAGNPVLDESGNPQLVQIDVMRKKTRLPYYKPCVFPIVLRKNITKYGSFLGMSDVDVIADQQEAIKKFGSKIDEKILKGGSFVTLPVGVSIDTNEKELKVVRVENAQQQSLISVINLQPDITKDQTQLEYNYQWAKSSLGITDSFQGKYDGSAQSGTAKQFAANQSAGRLQSKKMMKYACFSRLYELIFKWLVAYSDDPIPYQSKDENGNIVFAHFDPKSLIRVDAAGEPYWNDEFLFSVDESATIASNRETLWNMADVKFQSGAFGPINDLQSAAILWTWLEQTGYPGAGAVRKNIETRLSQQQQIQDLQQQIQEMKGGGQDAVPVL